MADSTITNKRNSVSELLIADIRSGRYPPGTTLPSEWDLVTRFSVSRNTVRGALAILVGRGLIERQKGQPTTIHALALTRLAEPVQAQKRVAVVLSSDKMLNPIFMRILESFHAHLPAYFRSVMFYHDFVKPVQYAEASVAIIDGGLGPQAIAEVRDRVSRVIVLNRQMRGLPCACTDNRAGGEMMVRHALAAGHRRLGVLHYGDSGTEEEFIHRLKGIRAACAKAAIRPVEVGMHLKRQSDFTPNQAVDMLLRIDPSITAILCLTDALALNVLESLGERGISVPGRLALIGFDDLPSSAFTSPALTTVRQSVEEIGEALVAGVEALIDGRPPGLGRPIRPHLVVRASCPLPGV